MRKFPALLAIVLTAVAAAGVLAGGDWLNSSGLAVETGNIPQLSLEGFSKADIGLDPGMLSILLTSGCRQLSILTSPEQMQSIAMGLEGDMGFRPLTHDLMENVLEGFDIEVLMVKVEGMTEGTYYAKLLLRQSGRILNIDSRPSDAIAIALRAGSPVYVKQELLEKYGDDVC